MSGHSGLAHAYSTQVRSWCEFGPERAYILMMFARKKHNDELTSSTEKVMRRVVTSEEDIVPNLHDLIAIAQSYPYEFRIYLTVNARNIRTAFWNFRGRLEDMMQGMVFGDDGSYTRVRRLDSEWKSALHQPECKADSYFHFDLDDVVEEDTERFINSLPGGYETWQTSTSTPGGWHVITDPFNYTDWEPAIEYDELDTDGMMHIAQID